MIEKVSIESIASISQGRYLPPGDMVPTCTPEAPIPVWGARGILGYTRKPSFRDAVPLVTCRGNGCGLVQWTGSAAYVSNNAMSIVPNTLSAADSHFLYYALLNESFADVTTGSAQPQITITHLSKKQICWHQDAVSRANVASILGALDDKIELNRKMSATLEAIARALFKSWFVDFDPVRAKAEGRDPGLPPEIATLFPNSFEDSELGEIPKGWRVGRISELCTTQYGYTASASNEALGSKFLRVMDINKRDWIEWQHVPYCVVDARTYESYALKVGDILVARMADPGKSAIVECDIDAIFASYLVRLKTCSLANSYFLYFFLKSSAYSDYVAGAKSGSVQANMNAKVIVAARLALPPERVIDQFSCQILALRQRLTSAVRQSQTLAAIRDALLPKLISGEIRVTDAERLVEQSA